MVERVVAAHNEVCEHDRDDDDDRKGDDAHDERVARGEHELFLQRALVVDKGVPHAEERAFAVAEAEINDIYLREDRNGAEKIAVQMHEEAAETLCILLLHGVQGVDREFEAPCCPLLEEEYHGGDDDRDNGECGSKVVVCTVFTEILIIKQHREGLEALAEDGGRTEVGKRLHEHHECSGEDGGHSEMQHDVEKTLHTGAAHICRGLHEGIVNALESTVHVDEHEREELERLRQGDAAEAVDAGHGDAEGGFEKLCDDTAASEQHDPRVRAQKRGGHATKYADDEEDFCALEAVERIKVSKRNTDHEREHRDKNGDLERIIDGVHIVAVAEKLVELLPREAAVRHDDCLLDDAEHRVNEHRDE